MPALPDATDVLAEYEEQVLLGQAPAVETLCAQHPHLPELRSRIRALEALRGAPRPTALAAAAPWPASLGGFTLLRPLGHGGMGAVFVARQATPRRLCAVKLLAIATPAGLTRFRREADAAAKLAHPGIAAVYASGVEGPHAYIATELVRGLSLRQALQHADLLTSEHDWLRVLLDKLGEGGTTSTPAERPLPPAVVLDIGIQAAEALGHAHGRGVVHRDVKPGNIMVSLDGQVKLIDFGIALDDAVAPEPLTMTGAFIGTLDYAAPEQLAGERQAIGPWSDVYSLGVTLFELATQQLPSATGSLQDRLATAVAPVAGPRQHNAAVPAALDAVIRRCLDVRHEARYRDGAELAEALRGCGRRGWPVPSLPTPRSGWGPRALWAALLAALIGLGALYGQATARLTEQVARDAAQGLRRDLAVLDWALAAAKPDLHACLRPATAPQAPPARPPTVEAQVVVQGEVVQAVEGLARGRVVDATEGSCLTTVLRRMRLPGVGLDGPVQLPVRFLVERQGGEAR